MVIIKLPRISVCVDVAFDMSCPGVVVHEENKTNKKKNNNPGLSKVEMTFTQLYTGGPWTVNFTVQ